MAIDLAISHLFAIKTRRQIENGVRRIFKVPVKRRNKSGYMNGIKGLDLKIEPKRAEVQWKGKQLKEIRHWRDSWKPSIMVVRLTERVLCAVFPNTFS